VVCGDVGVQFSLNNPVSYMAGLRNIYETSNENLNGSGNFVHLGTNDRK
jgi:hypothetical protein